MRCEKATIAENLEGIAHYLDEASVRGVEILALPEMCITGYADPIKHPEVVLRLDGPEVGRLLAMTAGKEITVLAGLIEENTDRKPFITQIVVRDGRLTGAYRKITIKGEEADWFSAGHEVPSFQHGDLTYGLAICADIGNERLFADLARMRTDIVFELAAPGLYGEQETRDWQSGFEWWQGECETHLSAYTREHGFWVAVATQAGRTVDEDFPGGGYVFAPGGQRVYATQDGRPGAAYLELDLQGHHLEEMQ
jgi:predicted amidohydrolase